MPRRKNPVSVVLPVAAALASSAAGAARGAGQRDNPFNFPTGPTAGVTAMPAPPPDAPPPLYMDVNGSAPAPRTPLMSLLGQAGMGDFLQRTGIDVRGWAEGSYNFNFSEPRDPHQNRLHLFDLYDSNFLLDQFDLTVERAVDLKSHHIEVGGRVDLLYGTDAAFIHSNGMLDHQGSMYQFDIPQLYVDLAIPVGDGLRLRLGKFEFFKLTDPNASYFFSHTFFYSTGGQPTSSQFKKFGNYTLAQSARLESTLVGAALPFTMTGVTAYYEFSKYLNIEAGFSNGFDQSLIDDNGAIDVFGRVNYSLTPQLDLSFALITGPEIAHDNGHFRTVGDLNLRYTVTKDFALLFDGFYGIQARPGTTTFLNAQPGNTGNTESFGGDAHWYGLNATAVYAVNKNLQAEGRVEWYRDEQGFTTGFQSDPGSPLTHGVTLYEATVGLTITPFPDSKWGSGFQVRPELRYDYSDQRFFYTHGGHGHDQVIVAVDAIYNF